MLEGHNNLFKLSTAGLLFMYFGREGRGQRAKLMRKGYCMCSWQEKRVAEETPGPGREGERAPPGTPGVKARRAQVQGTCADI